MPVTYIRKANPDPVVQMAERMEPRIKQAFLDAVAAVKNKVPLERLSKAIESGDVNQVMAILSLDKNFAGALEGVGLRAGVASVRDAVQATFAAAAKTAIGQLPKSVGVDLSFNLMNPESVKAINSYTFDLIQQVTADTKSAIQQVLQRAFTEGGHPYEQAREIRSVIGLTANQERAVQNYRAALEGGTSSDLRSALDRALRDGRYDKTVLRAINDNAPLKADKIDAMVERYRQRYIDYRAKNIARTESIRASNSGQRELWRQAREQGLLKSNAKRRWETSGDDRTCDVCDGLDGETAGFDEEFAPGIMEPPDPHPSCRCSVSLVFDKKAAA